MESGEWGMTNRVPFPTRNSPFAIRLSRRSSPSPACGGGSGWGHSCAGPGFKTLTYPAVPPIRPRLPEMDEFWTPAPAVMDGREVRG